MAGDRDLRRSIIKPLAIGPIAPCACANGAESAIFDIFFIGKENSGKKDFLLRSGLEPEPVGALAALDFKFGSYTFDCCSECCTVRPYNYIAIRDIWRKPTDSGITRYTLLVN